MKCPYCNRHIAVQARNQYNKMTDEKILKIRERRANGDLVEAIAYDFGISKTHVSNLTRDLSLKRRRIDAKEA